MAPVAIAHQGSRRNLDDHVLAAAPEAIRALAMLAAVCLPVPLVREVGEVGMTFGARMTTLPPWPPSPPLGPPRGAYFSRRKLRQPLPPAPLARKS